MRRGKLLFICISGFLIAFLNMQSLKALQTGIAPELKGIELGFNKTDIEYVKCSLNEPFAPDNYNYTATVDKSYTARMFITPFLPEMHKDYSLKINGAIAKEGEKFSTDVVPGENTVTITVSSPEGISKTYSIVITQKDMSTEYVYELIGDRVWRIGDFGGFPGGENMYLVEGSNKALLFDTGMGKGDLAALIKKLTNKPVEVAITHGHGDHTAQLDQFKGSVVYMSENDKGSLPKELDLTKFKWVKNGDIIDLGGGRSFEVIELPTHSKGQLVFLDKADGLAATGDAVGSGSMVWVFGVPFKDLSVYLDALKYAENKMKGLKGLTLMVGHHYQEKVSLTGLNGLQLFTDMRVLTQKVLAGEIIGDIAYQVRNGRVTELRQSYYGLAGLWYNPR